MNQPHPDHCATSPSSRGLRSSARVNQKPKRSGTRLHHRHHPNTTKKSKRTTTMMNPCPFKRRQSIITCPGLNRRTPWMRRHQLRAPKTDVAHAIQLMTAELLICDAFALACPFLPDVADVETITTINTGNRWMGIVADAAEVAEGMAVEMEVVGTIAVADLIKLVDPEEVCPDSAEESAVAEAIPAMAGAMIIIYRMATARYRWTVAVTNSTTLDWNSWDLFRHSTMCCHPCGHSIRVYTHDSKNRHVTPTHPTWIDHLAEVVAALQAQEAVEAIATWKPLWRRSPRWPI